jgi:hypothetical protein
VIQERRRDRANGITSKNAGMDSERYSSVSTVNLEEILSSEAGAQRALRVGNDSCKKNGHCFQSVPDPKRSQSTGTGIYEKYSAGPAPKT